MVMRSRFFSMMPVPLDVDGITPPNIRQAGALARVQQHEHDQPEAETAYDDEQRG